MTAEEFFSAVENLNLGQLAVAYVQHYDCKNTPLTTDDLEIAFVSGCETILKFLKGDKFKNGN